MISTYHTSLSQGREKSTKDQHDPNKKFIAKSKTNLILQAKKLLSPSYKLSKRTQGEKPYKTNKSICNYL